MERTLPDLPHRLFIYGTLKTGQPNHDHLEKEGLGVARYLCPARTKLAFPLVISTRWNIPFLLHAPGEGQLVFGEVYEVDDQRLNWLDEFEDSPEVYTREYITIDLLSNDVTDSVPNGNHSNNVSSKVAVDPLSNEISGCVNLGQEVTCWVYFLKNFPAAMLQMETYSSYDSNGIHRKKFCMKESYCSREDVLQSLKSHDASQIL